MTNQEIIEGNRLIAEFCGAKLGKDGKCEFVKIDTNKNGSKTLLPDNYKFPHWTFAFSWINDLKYHSSWDWLMPVVEKIESIKDDYHGKFQVFINSNQCVIQSINIFKKRKNDYYFNEYTLGSKIESTYMAVVKFIEWYNKNK